MKLTWTKFLNISSILLLVTISLAKAQTVVAYGESSGPVAAPICTNERPGIPWLYSVAQVSPGIVDLFWGGADKATSWTVAYGIQSGHYIYGISDFGNGESSSVRISGLGGGQYYFVIRANNNCMPGEFSGEQSIFVGGNRQADTTTGGGILTWVLGENTGETEEIEATTTISPTPTTQEGERREGVVERWGETNNDDGGDGDSNNDETEPTSERRGIFSRIFNFLFGWLRR